MFWSSQWVLRSSYQSVLEQLINATEQLVGATEPLVSVTEQLLSVLEHLLVSNNSCKSSKTLKGAS